MKHYTPWEFICIDVANAFGNDKMRFEGRVQWTQDNIHTLDDQVQQLPRKKQSMAIKATMALRDAQKGIPSGHMVGVDGSSSGIQMMSVLTGCLDGATASGLVDPDRRANAYAQNMVYMAEILGNECDIDPADAKAALMTMYYGSRAKPKEIFGEGTPELEAFYQAAYKLAPGPWELMDILRNSWNSYALAHKWKMPDGFDAVVKVMTEYTVANGNAARVEVDELDHSSFTYEYSVNEGQKKGLSNIANVTHSEIYGMNIQ